MSKQKKPRKSYINTDEAAPIDYDGKWKIIIETLFERFIAFFLFEIYHLIDFTKPVHFLKQDIEKIVSTNSKEDDQIYDNLAEVHLLNGEKRGLLIHIEVHGYESVNLGEKMFQYCYRGLDKFNLTKYISALLILVGDKLPQNYDGYSYKFGKTSIDYKYPVYIIRDQSEEELLKSDNPFALAVLACLRLLKIRAKNKRDRKNEYLDRFKAKKELLKLLEERFQTANYTEEEIVALVEFMMNIMSLPPKLEKRFKKEFYEPYIKQQQNMELSPKGRMYANMVGEAYFGFNFDDMMLKIQNWQEERKELKRKEEENRKEKEEAKRQAEESRKEKEEAKRKEEEAKRQAAELLKKQEKQILNLHENLKISKKDIAQAMELELSFVEHVIAKKEKNK